MNPMQKFQAAMAESEEGHWGIIDILTLILVFFIILYVTEMQESPVDSATAQAGPSPRQHSLAEQPIDVGAYFAGHARDGFYLAAADREITLVLEEKLSFAPGRAELGGDSFAVLDTVALVLKKESEYDAVISGHTDDLPIGNGEFRSNWHLATARAVAVAEYLLHRGVGPQRLTPQGFAEFRPLAANDSPAGREKNRRVEITLRARSKGGAV
jgi:chemotaxis protein MotB